RRVATFRRFFGWAGRHAMCRRNPLADRTPVRGRRGLPRPIREQHEQRALDASIARTSQPYRLIFLLLRETGMRVGEVLELRWGDVTLDAGREALRVREAKNGVERTVILRSNGYAACIAWPTRCSPSAWPRSGRSRASVPLQPRH